jgi:hypothetical protein
MDTRVVFSAGEWVSVELPVGRDPAWTPADSWVYAAAFAASQRAGHAAAKSSVLAEAIVNRRLYPGIVYEATVEKEIKAILS